MSSLQSSVQPPLGAFNIMKNLLDLRNKVQEQFRNEQRAHVCACLFQPSSATLSNHVLSHIPFVPWVSFAEVTGPQRLQLQFQFAARPMRLLDDPLESFTTACMTRRDKKSPRLLLVASDRVSKLHFTIASR